MFLCREKYMQNINVKYWIVALFIFLTSLSVQAEQMKEFDGPDGSEYQVHYMALTTTFLQPEVAKQYGIARSKARGLVNVSVIRKFPDGSKKAVGSVVEGLTINDIRQQIHMPFQQIVEGDAIYYISQVQFREGEILTFDLTIFPEGQVEPLKMRFAHTFYND